MKFYLCLLSILPTVIKASPTIGLLSSTDIERIEKRGDLDIAEPRYGVEVEHEPSHDFGSRLGKRLSPICSDTCGKVVVSDCLATLAVAANAAKLGPKSAFCATDSGRFFGNNCVITFFGHTVGKSTCISNARLAGLAQEVFNDCVNNPKVGFGGCVDLADGGHVCLRDETFANNICT